jgi:hypothetical protein
MRARCSLLALFALAACDRPEPLLICHNGNCVGPDTTRDDTLSAMTDSLALTRDGLPVLDGIEWDVFWYGKDSTCLFAHDLVHDTSTPASDAADLVADYLATHTRVSWRGTRFYALIDLKAHVGPEYSDEHTPAQLRDHADCALDSAARLLAGARAGGHQLTVGFISGKPVHLEVLTARPGWAALVPEPDLELLLIGDIFAPYAAIVPELADFTIRLDAVEYHPDFMTAQHRETYRSLGIDLVQWSYVSTTEALAAITRYEPRFAITNEAMLLRRWTEH